MLVVPRSLGIVGEYSRTPPHFKLGLFSITATGPLAQEQVYQVIKRGLRW